MPDADDACRTRAADDQTTTTRDGLTEPGAASIEARTAEAPDTDHCTLLPRIGTEVLGVSLRSLLDAGGSDGSSLRTVSQQDHYESLRAFRETDEFSRVRDYLGRRQQSVSFKPRSAALLQGETATGDRVDIAVASVDIRSGAHDEGFVILGRTVGDDEVVAAGIEYVETASRQVTGEDSDTTSRRPQTDVCVSMTAVDALGGLEEQQIAIDARQAAQQPAD